MAETYTGTCFCGAVEVQAKGEPRVTGYCHCRSCRVHSGQPVSIFTLWKTGDVTITRGEEHVAGVNRTGMTDRRFCTRCGGHVMVDHPTLGLRDIRPGILSTLTVRPTVHVNYAETVFPMHDGLPKLRDMTPQFGGSGELMEE
jgi:hypothetical protein